jgi:hypothetical protein
MKIMPAFNVTIDRTPMSTAIIRPIRKPAPPIIAGVLNALRAGIDATKVGTRDALLEGAAFLNIVLPKKATKIQIVAAIANATVI